MNARNRAVTCDAQPHLHDALLPRERQVLGMWDELIEEAVSSGRREVPSRRKLISGSIMLIFAMPIQ